MIDDPAVRRIAAAIIRSGNWNVLRGDETDDELLAMHGDAAEPFAQGLVDVIRDEVRAAAEDGER